MRKKKQTLPDEILRCSDAKLRDAAYEMVVKDAIERHGKVAVIQALEHIANGTDLSKEGRLTPSRRIACEILDLRALFIRNLFNVVNRERRQRGISATIPPCKESNKRE